MKLNKVLSLVVVIVMLFTMSSFAAFSDVKSDANYAEAVDVLSALKILDGYEDGSFKPDGKITRGEFSKVIAGATGMAESAKANATGGIFKDVAADLWSSGYIASAYQAGYVNGMGDGTFAPEAEVTYEQAVKMIVCALGYTPKATALGGYPTGYLMVANQEGVTVGTANAAGGASRATVARLVYNALTVSLMDQNSFGTDATFAKDPAQSLLFTKLNVVKADVVIDELSLDKTDTDVTLYVTKYDDVASYKDNGYVAGNETVKINGVDLKGLQGLMVSALIDVSDDSELKLLAVTKKAGKNKELSITPSLLVSTNSVVDNKTTTTDTTDDVTIGSAGYVTYYKTSDDDKTSKEQLEAPLTIYENLIKTGYTNISYVTNGTPATVRKVAPTDVSYNFVDTDNNGKYDTVFIINELSFVIGSVNTSSNKIFRETSNSDAMVTPGAPSSILLDPEDDNIDWSLKDAAGKDLTLADLKAGQVLNVKMSQDGGNYFYDIVITEEKIEGTISEVYTETKKVDTGSDTFYKIGDKAYKTVTDVTLNPGDQINATLNNAGKIIIYSAIVGVRNYAVVTGVDVTDTFGNTAQIQLITAKGEIVTLDLAKTVSVNGTSKTSATAYTTKAQLRADLTEGQLFIYETNSSNEIKTIYTTQAGIQTKDSGIKLVQFNTVASKLMYKDSSEKLGSSYILDSSTVFAVETPTLTDKKDIALASKSLFVDEEEYQGNAFVKDGDVQAVVLFSAGNTVKSDSHPMVVTTKATTSVDGDSRVKLKGFVNGEEIEYVSEEDLAGIDDIQVNDVILFNLNGNKEISAFTKLVDYTSTAFTAIDNGNLGGTAADDTKLAVAGQAVALNLAKGTAASPIAPNLVYTVGATSQGTTLAKGFAAAGKAYEVKGKTLRLINNFPGTFGNDPATTEVETRYYGLNDSLISDFSVNSSAVAYIYNGTTKKIKATTIADLESDKSTVDSTTSGRDNDDLVYVYNYDGETYMILIIDTEGDN